ncbi:PD-(D/E)XK motif protein [Planctomycetaceae bacterium]|nr:PD-(D/E)XK motif protein [Planctomycetaceae bacterium]
MSNLFTKVVDSLTNGDPDGSHIRKRINAISAVNAFAAIRVSDSNEALILEIDTAALTGISEWPSTRGLEVCPEPLQPGAGGTSRLLLQLTEERFRDVFRSLGDDVCSVLTKAPDDTAGVREFHRRLVRWQSFLQKYGPDGLGPNLRCGLYGELFVLRKLMLPLLGAETAVSAWRGCKKANQDFQLPDRALEVKTTRSGIPDRISISNVQQLDDEGMAHMFLTVVQVHANETTGETLPEIIERLKDEMPDNIQDMLDSGLEEVGYLDSQSQLYSSERYQPIELFHHQVREGFPRLSRSQIPDGVKKVRYDISFDSCKPFRIDEQRVIELLTKG